MFGARLSEICNKIIQKTREVEVKNGTEEDLKIKIENILRKEVWEKLGVPEPRYEYTVREGVTAKHWKRLDALYGLTIFEYKRPNELKKVRTKEEAIRKMKNEYIPYLLNDRNIETHIKAIKDKGQVPIIAGVIWDGYHIIFCEYNCQTGEFTHSDAYVLNPETLRRVISIVIATYKKKIDARILASDFGYKSEIVRTNLAVKKLYYKLENPSERTRKLFNEWLKLTSQAFSISGEELAKIARDYGFEENEIRNVNGLKLFFAIQTYYALIIKLLSVEVCARFYNSLAGSFFKEIEIAMAENNLKEILSRLESGWYYTYFGVKNFLEGEFFSWYLDEWDNEIEEIIKKIISTLLEYDIESIVQDPSSARDIFKLLYEELVPRKEVRQKLGIYTTPDWLAELIIDELIKKAMESGKSYEDLIESKWLDPGCGTGTFLSLVIKKIAKIGRSKKVEPSELLKKICSNIVGFDIDSLSVLTARANYLIALASERLLEYKGEKQIEIPVYLANSIITAEEFRSDAIIENKVVKVVEIEAGGKKFLIPLRILNKAIDLLNELKDFIEAQAPFENKELQKILTKYNLSREELVLIANVYNTLLQFKKAGVDSVWIPILKSYMVSIYFKDFDFVIGNPPWIAYRYITSIDYQRKVKDLIKDVYNLVLDEHLMTHMEIATLFVVRCLDIYLKHGGLLGFVMPKSIMYSDQHHNFRIQNTSVDYKIEKIIDCNVQPLFYVPTCAIIVRKSTERSEEIPAIFIKGKLPEEKHKTISLKLASASLDIREGKLYLNYIGTRSFLSENKIRIAKKRSYYYNNFYQGATVVPQPCWFVDIINEEVPLIKTSKRAKARGKTSYEIGPLPIEKEFLYYILTSAEVLPFCHLDPGIVVLPLIQSTNNYLLIRRLNALSLGKVHLAKWLENVERIWENTRGEKAQKMDIYERIDRYHLLTNQNPNAEYIVVYIRSATHLASCVVDNNYWKSKSMLKKPVIIESTLYRFFTNVEDEAYYLMTIFNSSILDALIKPMQSKGFGGVERDIHKKPLEFPIPKFNRNNDIHKQLSELGKKAAKKAYNVLPKILKERGYDVRLKTRGTLVPTEVANLRAAIREELLEELNEIDELVKELFISFKDEMSSSGTLEKYLNMQLE